MAEKPIEYKGYIRILKPYTLFEKYNVTKTDLLKFRRLIENNREEEAIDLFIEKYVVRVSDLYTDQMVYYMNVAQEGELKENDKKSITGSVMAFSGALALTLNSNFRSFVKESFAPTTFDNIGVKSAKVQKAILENTIAQFETLTEGAMAETQKDILANIRKIQKDIIVANQRISSIKDLSKTALDREVWNFKKRLFQKYPDYFQSMLKGRVLKSRRFGENGEQVRHYKLDYYADMSVRTTILNVDRTSVEVVGEIEGQKIFEYYLRDNRKLKSGKERLICKSILARKILGRSILTTDPEIAAKLNIPMLDQVKADGAMGFYCRHSIRMVSNTYKKRVYKQYKLELEEVKKSA